MVLVSIMINESMLDMDGNPLKLGAMYCDVTIEQGVFDYGGLIRYCGKNPDTGRAVFADADTWDEAPIYGDVLVLQLGPVIDPTTKGWPCMAE